MSQTIVGLLITILGIVATQFKIEVSHDQIVRGVEVAVMVYGALHTWWGRYRQGDITWYGAKLNQDVNLGVAKQ
jgi:hypothetical protein